MSTADVSLAGAVDTADGAGLGVYQDHGQIRIDIEAEVKLDRVTLDIAAVSKLITVLRDATIDARLWELEQQEPARLDGCTCTPIRGAHHHTCPWHA